MKNFNSSTVLIDGLNFNNLVVKAKNKTYEKYKYLGSLGIAKKEFEDKCKVPGKH